MKTIAHAQQSLGLPTGASRVPEKPDDRAARRAFYFMMGMLALGMIYFLVLAVWMSF